MFSIEVDIEPPAARDNNPSGIVLTNKARHGNDLARGSFVLNLRSFPPETPSSLSEVVHSLRRRVLRRCPLQCPPVYLAVSTRHTKELAKSARICRGLGSTDRPFDRLQENLMVRLGGSASMTQLQPGGLDAVPIALFHNTHICYI